MHFEIFYALIENHLLVVYNRYNTLSAGIREMDRLNIEELETFLSVERHKSFTKAAEDQFCTQATVSRRIKRLEEELAVQLFKREHGDVTLTIEGRVFLPHARQLFGCYRNLHRQMAELHESDYGRIDLAASGMPGTFLIPSILTDMKKQHPHISVNIRITSPEDVVRAVKKGDFPLGITSFPVAPKEGDLDVEFLMEDPLVLVVGKEHHWANSEGIYLRQLQGEQLIVGNAENNWLGRLYPYVSEEDICCMGNCEAAKYAVYHSFGAALMPQHGVEWGLRTGDLIKVPVLDQGNRLKGRWYFIHRKDIPLTPVEVTFKEFVISAVENQLGRETELPDNVLVLPFEEAQREAVFSGRGF